MIDPLRFNIRDEQGRLLCPACGFPNYANGEAYDERGGVIGTTICPCCFWEPGYDDSPGASGAPDDILESLHEFRTRWNAVPAWLGREELRPSDWDAAKQLAQLFVTAPYVR